MVKVMRKMEVRRVDGRRDSGMSVNLVGWGGRGGLTNRVQLACALPPPAGERASPEQAAPGTEDNAETPAGAEVTPCTPTCLSLNFSATFPIWGQKEARVGGAGEGGVVWW